MVLTSFPVRRKHNTNLLFHLSSHYILMMRVQGGEHWRCWSRFINSLTGELLLWGMLGGNGTPSSAECLRAAALGAWEADA